MSEADPSGTFTPAQRVLRYYPQRVQVLVLAAFNLLFVALTEFTGIEFSTVFIGTVNSFGIALMVFFYGEKKTVSQQHVRDQQAGLDP